MLQCRFKRTDPRAVMPTKAEGSRGYDLTLIDVKHQWELVTIYTTGLICEPPVGWVYDIVPRSSISKTGYLLANSTGIIDNNYRGELLIALYKYDDSKPDLALPCKLAQVLFKQQEPDVEFVEYDIDLNTNRGAGGFGSTGK